MLLLPIAALAAVPDEERYLVNDRLAVGLASDGSLINSDLGLGIVWDPDGPEGATPPGGDLLTPGYFWAPWALSLGDGTELVMDAAYDGASDLELSWVDLGLGPTLSWLRAEGQLQDLDVDLVVAMPYASDVLLWRLSLTASTPVTGLRVAVSLDPDPDFDTDGTYETVNASGPGYAGGASEIDPVAVALASAEMMGGICSWCTSPAGFQAGAGQSNTGDYQVGIFSDAVDLAAGEGVVLTVAYAMGDGLEDAVAVAQMAALDTDWDDDGVDSETDCDDLDGSIHPGAAELADGVDQDCDGLVDEDSLEVDDDGDGYAEADGDCDDADPAVHPGAVPTGSGDADCDGIADGDWSPDVPADVDQAAESPEGCGCATTQSRPLPLALLALLLLARRRA